MMFWDRDWRYAMLFQVVLRALHSAMLQVLHGTAPAARMLQKSLPPPQRSETSHR